MTALTDKSALVVKIGQIGDVIMAIPAAWALHEEGYVIDWVCGRAARPILECYSWIRVIPVDDAAMMRGGGFDRMRCMAAFWLAIRRKQYDLCGVFYFDWRYRLLTLPVRAKRTVILSHEERAYDLLPTRSHADEFVRILLDQDDGYRDQSAPPIRPDRLPPSALPQKLMLNRIALVPGAAQHLLRNQVQGRKPQSLRRWPIENYVALARHLLARRWEVVLLGGPDEEWVRPHFAGVTVTDCLGKLALGEVVSVCNTCDAVVSNDTGPLHLAGLSETCLVGLFGPTNPSVLLPRRNFSVGLWGGEGFACRPCFDGVDFAPCQFNGCMHQITPERVLRELDRLLDERSRGVPSAWKIAFPSDAAGVGLG